MMKCLMPCIGTSYCGQATALEYRQTLWYGIDLNRPLRVLLQISKLPVVLFHLFPSGEISQHPVNDVARAVCQVYQGEAREYNEVNREVLRFSPPVCSQAAAAAASSSSSSSQYYKPPHEAVSPDRPEADFQRDSSPEWSGRSTGVVPQASADLRVSRTRQTYYPDHAQSSVEYNKPLTQHQPHDSSHRPIISGSKMTAEEIGMEVAKALSVGQRVFRVKVESKVVHDHAHVMTPGDYFVEAPLPDGQSSRRGMWSWGFKIGDSRTRKWFLNDASTVEEII